VQYVKISQFKISSPISTWTIWGVRIWFEWPGGKTEVEMVKRWGWEDLQGIGELIKLS